MLVVILIAAGLWFGILMLVVAICAAAARGDEALRRATPAPAVTPVGRRRERWSRRGDHTLV